jgi:hypothetical protein
MSNSRPPQRPRRFLTGFLAGLAAPLALTAAVMLVVDPFGATPAGGICPAGPQSGMARIPKMLIAQRTRPRTIVLGTSRVDLAFERASIALLGPPPGVNLGLDGSLAAAWAALSEESLAGGRLQRVYLGVDFNLRHQAQESPAPRPFVTARWPAGERWRQALASYEAFRALPQAVFDCRPRFHRDGTPILDASGRTRGPRLSEEGQASILTDVLRRSAERADLGANGFAERSAALRRMIAALRRRDVEVVLFSAPYREELVAIFERTGWATEFSRFHEDMERLAREQRVPFVDFHDPAAVSRLQLPPCPGRGIGCHYTDLTHYHPLVAERMAPLLRRAADEFDWTPP